MNGERRVVLYIAMSLDGYIAGKDGNIDFLSPMEKPGEDYGYAEFLKSVDTIIWGRKTFNKVLSFGNGVPHRDKNIYVISRTRTGHEGHAVYRNDVVELIRKLQHLPGKNIYCDGGAEIVSELLENNLLDSLIISVIPHLLGDGIRLFREGLPEHKIRFIQNMGFPSGLVQLWYDVLS